MKSLFLVARLVLVQILFLTTSPSLADMEVNLPPDYTIEIVKGNNRTGLSVTYLFKSPVTEFVMPGRGEKPLEVRFSLNSGGFIIDGNNVRHLSGEGFSAVSFTLEPDIRKIDRAYPTLFKTSRDALVLFPENLIVNDLLPDKITISAASGESVNLDGSSQRNLVLKPETLEDLRRFLMIGAWQSYRVDMFEVIGAERLPEYAASILEETLNSLTTTLEMPTAGPENGVIAIFIENSNRGANQMMGDVAANGAMHLAIPMEDQNPGFKNKLRIFIGHEVFHTWAGLKSTHKNGNRYAWLHEGMAELFGIAYAAGGFNNASDQIVQKIQTCSDSLALKGSKGQMLDYASGHIPYSCGVAFHWYFLETIGVNPSEFSPADYANLISEKILSVPDYGPAQFFQILESKFENDSLYGLIGFSELAAPDNINSLYDFVGHLKAPIVGFGPPNANPDRVWAYTMWHFVSEICPDGWRGFSTTREEYLELDLNPEICDPVVLNLKLTKLNGFNFFGERARVIEEVVMACKNQTRLIFEVLNSSKRYLVQCQHPVPPLPPLFQWRD